MWFKKIPNIHLLKIRSCVFLVVLMFATFVSHGQPVPGEEENIPYLVTFGNKAGTHWGDNDYSQVFFFTVPETYKGMVFIRVFDPDVGGKHDELNGEWNTKMRYSVYGGKDAYLHPDNSEISPKKNFKRGTQLATRTFGVDPQWDDKWFTFGPFAPTAGEYDSKYGCFVFKVVCEGIEGDDGNMYRYFMSTSGTANTPIEGGNAFAYEYTFRLHDSAKEVSHIYPYVDDDCVKILVRNFDWDDDGIIRVTSEVRREQKLTVSGDNVWMEGEFPINPDEKGKSLDFQFIKRQPVGVKNNNVVIYIRKQNGDLVKFYSSPIGGVPKYKYGIEAQKKPSTTKK